MFKIFCVILLIILEIPFYFKIRQVNNDFVRQTAIAMIMVLIALIVAGIYYIGLFMLR